MRKLLNRHSLILSASVIFLAAFAMRLGAIKQYVTPDEPIWVLRSLNFSAALSQGDWAGTAQIGHPGVTTMWLGSLGIQLKHLADPMAAEQSAEWLRHVPTLTPENGEAFKHLGVFLTFARMPVILVNGLGIVGIFLLARRMCGQTTALLAEALGEIES